ncbi:facilitated trehalose transporter Tret1-like [Cylas formicarius]|uniref:facilitated trehalose transporter Tret1-like n=1 Tax=Cylas formicarius TaxID=197179 RepID=UPI002958807B|nr:facilitated trehalose transporter Tret1-like [Cylas formicarius]
MTLKSKGLHNAQEEEKHWPQILATLIVSLAPLSNGIFNSWVSPSIPYMLQHKDYHLTEDEAAYFTVIPSIATMISSVFCYRLLDFIGRKKTMLLIAIPHLVAWIIIIFDQHTWTLYIARIMSGVADAAMYCATPAYIGEITTPTVRGIMGNSINFMMTLGEFGINLSGHFSDVKTTAYVCIAIPICYVLLLSRMPESPYYLLKIGKLESAKASLTWLRRKEHTAKDFAKLNSEIQRQVSETGTWLDLLTKKSNRRALLIGIFLRFSQQLSGIAIFLSYTQPIFQKTGNYLSAQLASDIFFGLFSVISLIGSFTVEKFGRKVSYFYTALFCGIILFLLSIYFFMDQYRFVDTSPWNWIPLFGMFFFVISFSLGVGVVPTLMLAELFSVKVKAKCLCVLVIVHGLSSFLTNFIFHQLSMHVRLYCPFLVFSFNCLISAAITLRFLPETKGKTLETIQQDLKRGLSTF